MVNRNPTKRKTKENGQGHDPLKCIILPCIGSIDDIKGTGKQIQHEWWLRSFFTVT
ncbi:hypothetical protein LINGRAPRIM_LOCUS613 [Linum grandiflorum]